jgi:hypothetical protein
VARVPLDYHRVHCLLLYRAARERAEGSGSIRGRKSGSGATR